MLPSRDHTPTTSSAGSKVKRELPPPVVLSIQTSTLLAFWSLISSATRLPSGESVGLYYTAGWPISAQFFARPVDPGERGEGCADAGVVYQRPVLCDGDSRPICGGLKSDYIREHCRAPGNRDSRCVERDADPLHLV